MEYLHGAVACLYNLRILNWMDKHPWMARGPLAEGKTLVLAELLQHFFHFRRDLVVG